jgi:hypothetical protein
MSFVLFFVQAMLSTTSTSNHWQGTLKGPGALPPSGYILPVTQAVIRA